MAPRRCGPCLGVISLLYMATAFQTTPPRAPRWVMRASGGGANGLPPAVKPEGFLAPEPKLLGVSRAGWLPVVATSSVAIATRLAAGVFVTGWEPRLVRADAVEEGTYALRLGPVALQDRSGVLAARVPLAKDLILYEYEASPYCRKVREALSMLDLTVEFRPCPGARQGFARDLERWGGKMMVPFLVDPNTGESMYESDDIVAYLFETYGPGKDKIPWLIRGAFSVQSAAYAAAARGFAGSRMLATARPDNQKMKIIELWGYEGSPFVRPVREKLGELGLAHRMIYTPRGSARRDELVKQTGRFQVPFLRDPNTGVEMFESAEICEYLEQVYTVEA